MRTSMVLVGVLVLCGSAQAAQIGVVPKKLIVVDKLGKAGKAKVAYVTTDKTAGITKGTGTDVGQISARFDVAYWDPGTSSPAGSFTLPAGASNGTDGWVVNAETVAKYVNISAPGGPTEAKVAVVKPGRLLKLAGKGLGDVPLDILGGGDPDGPVITSYCVTNGAEENCHCSWFTGCVYKTIAGGTGAKLLCKKGGPDPFCTVLGCESFVDAGLSVIDDCTGLEWEKKTTAVGSGANPGNLHDVDNEYTWAGRCTVSGALCQPDPAAATTCATQTGSALGCTECGGGEGICDADPFSLGAITTIWDWVNQLNAASFAGHTDWRLATGAGDFGEPVGSPPELESIVDLSGPCGPTSACIDPVFGPTAPDYHWTASTQAVEPGRAFMIYFGDGHGVVAEKWGLHSVRAVRPSS